MPKFEDLLKIADRLLGEGGCPWDRKQTFSSLQPYVIEEAHEVVEAVTEGEDHKIAEELGDLLYTIVFYAKLAEKEKRFTMGDVIGAIQEKLIRRHPHVFGEGTAKTSEEVVETWEKIKKGEKGYETRTSALDGIPKTLTGLLRAQKMVKKMRRAGYPLTVSNDQDVGHQLLALLMQADEQELDAETVLRSALHDIEKSFRKWELK